MMKKKVAVLVALVVVIIALFVAFFVLKPGQNEEKKSNEPVYSNTTETYVEPEDGETNETA
jgi:flagellar basal body-associated protein FliL